MSIVLKNGTLSNGEKVDILIKKRKIKNVSSEPIEISGSMKVLDLKGLLVLPGMVEMNVQMQSTDHDQEDYISCGRACVANGITTFCDKPDHGPKNINLNNLLLNSIEAKKSAASVHLYTELDANSTYKEVKAMIKYSKGIKVSLNDNSSSFDVLKLDKRIFKLKTLFLFDGEGDSIYKIRKLIFNKNARIHICQISSKDEYINYLDLKSYYNNLTFEVSPHHLILNNENFDIKPLTVSPSLKSKYDQEFLLSLLKKQRISCIASNHIPFTLSDKRKWKSGFGGVDTTLKLLLELFKKFELDLDYLEYVYSTNPASILNIKNVGRIKKGYDADIIVVDTKSKNIITNEQVLSKCKWTPFNGAKVSSKVALTFVKGKLEYIDEKWKIKK
ncbi:MAG: amidohydrolase family protein [Mycoplasma sp.]